LSITTAVIQGQLKCLTIIGSITRSGLISCELAFADFGQVECQGGGSASADRFFASRRCLSGNRSLLSFFAYELVTDFEDRQKLLPDLGVSPNPKSLRRRHGSSSAPLSRLLGRWRFRSDAARCKQALDDHQLSPVVHLMLLGVDQHLEAVFAPGSAFARYDLGLPGFGSVSTNRTAFPLVAQHATISV